MRGWARILQPERCILSEHQIGSYITYCRENLTVICACLDVHGLGLLYFSVMFTCRLVHFIDVDNDNSR